MISTIEALWRAIDAAPAAGLLRGILADVLDERNGPGDADTAKGLRATKEKVPRFFDGEKGLLDTDPRSPTHSWNRLSKKDLIPRGHDETDRANERSNIGPELFAALRDGYTAQAASWRDGYPTARAALLDLVAAWVAVEREKGAGVCEGCYGSEDHGPAGHGNWKRSECPACSGSGNAAPAEVRE